MSLGKNFDIIVRTLTTEKTARAAENNQFYFEVVASANKDDVKKAIQDIFDVIVEGVNIINTEEVQLKKLSLPLKKDRILI